MASQPTNNRYPDYIVVKFKDSVKLPYSDSFVQNEANLDRAGLSPLNQIFHEFEGTIMQRLFNSVPPEEVASLEETATREPAFTGEMGLSPRHSNILSYFRIIPPPNINAESIIERLRQLDFVEEAYIEGKPTPPPFVNQSDDPLAKFQAYEASAPQGIDSHFAWTLRGGDGESLQFVDLEQGWTLNHEDLVAKGITIISGVNNRFFAHGTNVLGEIAGVDNNVGIVGIGPNLDSVQVVSQWRTASNFSTADAILSATNHLVKEAKQRKKGESVLLLEAQTTVSHTMPGVHLPVEVEPAVFDAIKLATNSGIIVVEAAGNGLNNGGPGADLDQFVNTTGKRVLNRNSPDFKDSGAIIVAAASSGVPHSRMSFSNFGSRIDCYAWGENVTTSGSSKAPSSPTAYTKTFSGTSSASPIIAGAALALQGISEAYLGTSFSPLNMRSMLSVVATGTTSANPSVEKIGVMPDLKKIITVSMGLTPAAILAKDLAALVNELLGGGLIPRPLCHTFGKAMPVLKAGTKGPQVEFLQRALAHIKHPTGAFDGIFGEQTKAAVLRFQASQGLAQDGIVGPNTWGTICTSLSSAPSAIVLCPAFSKAMPVLKAGTKGPQVEFLQRALAHIKHPTGAFDGIFGEQTKAAVNRFQTSVKLSSDGITGPNTWGALCTSFSSAKKKDVVTLGSRGGEVRVLQHFLSKQGFGPALIDGIFSDSTRNAVMQFQKRSGLIPNGIVQSATWAKLLQSKLLVGSQQQESIREAGGGTLEISSVESLFQSLTKNVALSPCQNLPPPKVTPGSGNFLTKLTACTGGIKQIGGWEEPDGSRKIEIIGVLKPSVPRTRNFNQYWPTGKENNLKNYQISHLWGPGFGDEAFDGMMYAHVKVNNGILNHYVEKQLRKFQEYAAKMGKIIALKVVGWSYPVRTWRGHPILKHVDYRLFEKNPDGTTKPIGYYYVITPPPNSNGDISGMPKAGRSISLEPWATVLKELENKEKEMKEISSPNIIY